MNRILASLITVATLFYGVIGADDFILCIGEDGHIAVERKAEEKTGGCCGDASHDHDHGCGDCIDLPISLDTSIMPSVVVSSNGLECTGLAEDNPVSISSSNIQLLPIPEAIPPPSSISRLRTVLLLI